MKRLACEKERDDIGGRAEWLDESELEDGRVNDVWREGADDGRLREHLWSESIVKGKGR